VIAHRNRRRAFTLLEILVVLAIIGLLAALTAGALFRYRASAMEKDTVTQIRKIQIGVDQQWKAARDVIQKENPPQEVIDATCNSAGVPNMARARAYHMKLRLKQEFPQSYIEARTPARVTSPITGSVYIYPMKESYKQEIGQSGPVVEGRPGYEGAALLFLILKQGRGGMTFDAGGIGNVRTETVEARVMSFYVDAWGHPIVFRRAAEDDEINIINELSNPPFAPASGQYKDPQDPEGFLTLSRGNWPGYAEGVRNFTYTPLLSPFDGTNRGPYVLSAGQDGQFKTSDDVCGFRVQQSNKGN
jgi:prepilin-type N-terminal cleavage/methylation domain-containing protein